MSDLLDPACDCAMRIGAYHKYDSGLRPLIKHQHTYKCAFGINDELQVCLYCRHTLDKRSQ